MTLRLVNEPLMDHPTPRQAIRLHREKSLVLSDQGDLRIGPIRAIPDVLTEMGVRPAEVFAVAGVDLALFRDPDSRVPFEAIGRLLQAGVAATRCDHFGLLVGERFELTGLGPIGRLMRNETSVGDALRSLVLHLHLQDRGASPVLLAPDRRSVMLGYSIYRHGVPASAQVYDAAVAIGYKILRELCGLSWKLLRVQFAHGRPAEVTPYRRLFGTGVFFDADVSGLVFDAAWLEKTIEGADPARREDLTAALHEAEAVSQMSFSERVRITLHQLILSGAATSGNVARLFGVDERTIRRHLHSEGSNLRALISEARFELAQQLLRNTGLSIAEIAAALQYADSKAFSRAFRSWAEMSPTQWRAQAAACRET
jgi:AraC-like DNA-binding protein